VDGVLRVRNGIGFPLPINYIGFAAGRVRSNFPRAYKLFQGADPDRNRGSGHSAPTYTL